MIIKITTEKDYKVFDNGVWVRTISKYDTYISEVDEKAYKEALKYFKKSINVKRMPKCFSVEVVKFEDDKIHTIYGNESTVYLVHKDKIIYEWNNNSNTDYPEDLTWERDISEVFYSGLKLGMDLSKKDVI